MSTESEKEAYAAGIVSAGRYDCHDNPYDVTRKPAEHWAWQAGHDHEMGLQQKEKEGGE